MKTIPREREQTGVGILLRLAFVVGLYGLLLLLCGCGESVFPDSRTRTSGNIRRYEQRLEQRLRARYNNLADYAGQIAKVDLVLTRKPERSMDGKEIRVEFSQLVYDKWGHRVPDLEREYYLVTFGYGTPRLVRTDPSLTIGMHTDGDFSENYPADPTVHEPRRLRSAPAAGGKRDTSLPPAPLSAPALPSEPRPRAAPAVPVVPPVGEDLEPAIAPDTQAAAPATKRERRSASAPRHVPSLLRALAPSRRFRGRLPRNEIRNLPRPGAGPGDD